MHVRHSSRLPKGSKKSPRRTASPGEDVVKHKVEEKRQRTGKRRTKSGDSVANAAKRHRDIIDLISSPREADAVAKEDEGASVEIPDNGLDESSDDCASVSSSVHSGPSLHYRATLSQGRCPACQKLYKKAKRMKAPLKNKLLDNDPMSLTCDQWVLIKKRKMSRLSEHNARGKLLICVHLIKKSLGGRKGKQRKHSPSCSQPHIYLERNLRRCVQVPLKQERKTNKRRKRTRDDSQGSRVAKQQRVHSNGRHRRISSVSDSHNSAGPQNCVDGFEDYSDQEMSPAGPSHVINTTTTTELPSKQMPKAFQRGFRDLLVQLRGNSSMIVKETH